MTRAFVFPGQGAQFIGMGYDLAQTYPEARAVFDRVDQALGSSLSELIFAGQSEALNLTANTQPALMAVSMAVFEVLTARGLDLRQHAAYVAGHSLGEYAALTAAGALDIEDTARLLRLRAEAMQRAVPVGQGAMAAILGLEFDVVADLAAEAAEAEAAVCAAANDNSVGQVVVSGAAAAVDRAIALAVERGAKKAVALPVSAPFHCALMQPAADVMAEALADVRLRAPVVPVVANVTAAPVVDPDAIRELLVKQVTGVVRWRESVQWMAAQGVDSVVELGAGKVLSGLIRRIDRAVSCTAVGTAEQVEAFAL